MRPRRRTGKPLKRITERRPELRTIVVFCEGTNSEPDYVKGLKELPHVAANTSLNIEVDPNQGAPITLVQRAAARAKDAEVDECWCLFDVEWPQHHPNLAAAIDMARRAGVKLAISNPCFEMWLIWHIREHTRFVDTDTAERLSRGLDQRQGKSIDADYYMPLRKEAMRRAVASDERHAGNGTLFPHDNPSSGMYRFLETIEPD